MSLGPGDDLVQLQRDLYVAVLALQVREVELRVVWGGVGVWECGNP